MNDLRKKIQEALKCDDQEQAMNHLFQYVRDNNIIKTLIIQSGQLHSLKFEYNSGQMDWSEMRKHKNKISNCILAVLEDVERIDKLLPLNLNSGDISNSVIEIIVNNNPEILKRRDSITENLKFLFKL